LARTAEAIIAILAIVTAASSSAVASFALADFSLARRNSSEPGRAAVAFGSPKLFEKLLSLPFGPFQL